MFWTEFALSQKDKQFLQDKKTKPGYALHRIRIDRNTFKQQMTDAHHPEDTK
jgi:hypothetical protein